MTRDERCHQMGRDEYEAYLSQNSRKRKHRRKNHRGLVAGILITLSLFTCFAVFVTFFLRLGTITVVDAGLATKQQIIAASGFEMGDNLLFLPLDQARKKIMQLNPCIESCKVERKFPTGVVITLQAGKESSQAEIAGGYAVLSRGGRVMRLQPAKADRLPVIRGMTDELTLGSFAATGKDSGYRLATRTIELLQQEKMDKITLVDVRDIYEINVLYDNRVRLILGNENDLSIKISTVSKTFQTQFSATDQGVIDGSVALYQAGVRRGASHLEYFDLTKQTADTSAGTSAEKTSGQSTKTDDVNASQTTDSNKDSSTTETSRG